MKKKIVENVVEDYLEDADQNESPKTLRTVMKKFFKAQGYGRKAINTIMKNFEKGIPEEEEETEMTHGTSCPMLLSKDHKVKFAEF